MNLDDEELAKTKSVKSAYDVVYRNMEYYIDRYNELENEIQNNYYSKEKILKALGIKYREQDLSEDRICSLIESLLKEKRRVEKELENKTYNITIPLENTGLEDIEYYYKKGDKWYAHYKETQVDKTKVKELEEQAKSKVTEKELKDMILGMLE